MTYKAKFDALEQRAHNKIIATKILRDMTTFRSQAETSPTAPRRWVWELIQNAKDVNIDGGVKIRIEHKVDGDKSHLIFKHTGKPFTTDNIRFLIEQISSKDREKDEHGKNKTTGKFGTGFLSTHLLSEIVTVKGVAKEPELDYRQFELVLDRSGYTPEAITKAVEIAKHSMEDLDEYPVYKKYVEGAFNTSFHYPLEDEVSQNTARAGIKDLEACLPYTLLFVEEIVSVELRPLRHVYSDTNTWKRLDDNIFLASIQIEEHGKDKPRKLRFVVLQKGLTSIAIPVKKAGDTITILPIGETIPKLFCDFPLIGSEKFSFPVIINNPNFNPTDPRDGVFLTPSQKANPPVDENVRIVTDAIKLYIQLLKYAVDNNWKNLHLLAQVHQVHYDLEWLNKTWHKTNVVDAIRTALLYEEIVNTSDGKLGAILYDKGKKYVWFPHSAKKEIREKIWECANDWFPHCLPRKSDIELWYKLSWAESGKLTVDQLAAFVEDKRNIDQLSEVVKGEEVYEWLTGFYELMEMEEKEYDAIINKRAIFPNQHGLLCKKSNLHGDDGTIGDDFKEVLTLLGNDIKKVLADENLKIDFEPSRIWGKGHAVKEIITNVTEKTSNRDVAKGYKEAFRKLLLWFRTHPKSAEKLFPTIYANKHLLYDDEVILENIEKAEQLNELLTEFNATDIPSLRELLKKKESQNSLLPVTQEIIASMGITSLEDWQEALKDKNLAVLFSHESTPTTDMFVYAQTLIEDALGRIEEHLDSLPNYDLSAMEQTAPTVLAGILKDGQSISIVARPAHHGEVIIYYPSERDILDYEPSELWIYDGSSVRQITLGHILKKADIRKFPI